MEVWHLTEGLPYCNNDALYPTASVRWGLTATASARHWIYINCDRLCMIIDPICRGKLWLIFTPDKELSSNIFSDIDQFSKGFDVTNPPDFWAVKVVYLKPGTRL